MKKAVEADELVRSAKGEQVARPTEQRSTAIQNAMPLGGRNHAPSQALTDEADRLSRASLGVGSTATTACRD
jgi:hypothetical protein